MTVASLAVSPDTPTAVAPEIREEPAPLPDPALVNKRRNEGIDVIRFFAAAGIVFVHTTQSELFEHWGHFFRFAVPFFLFASLYYQTLSFRRKTDVGLGEYILGRFKRLYIPFAAWCVIYLIVRDVKRVAILHFPLAVVPPSVVWKGTEYHLYFLPLLLAASIVLVTIHKLVLEKNPRMRWPMAAIALVAAAIAIMIKMPASMGETFEDPGYVWYMWRLAMPAVFMAMAFAWIMAAGPVVYGVSSLVGWGGIGMTLAFSFWQVKHGIELIPRALTGLGCMLAALSPWHGKWVPMIASLGRRGYGIYLCHILPVEVLKILTRHRNMVPTPMLDLAVFAISFVSSIGIVLLLERSKKTAWLNG